MYSPEPVGVQKLFAIALFALLLIPSAVGQTGAQSGRPDLLTIVNARQTDIPIERARVLLVTACRVVAEEFHKRPEDLNLRMKLILGESHERVFVDDSGSMTLYLEQWNETKFVDGIITGAMQLLMPLDTRKHVFTEILRRTDKIAPVAANQLRVPTPNSALPRRSLAPDCISAVYSGPCSWPNRLPDR